MMTSIVCGANKKQSGLETGERPRRPEEHQDEKKQQNLSPQKINLVQLFHENKIINEIEEKKQTKTFDLEC